MKSISICPQTLFEFELPSDLLAETLAGVRTLEYAPNQFDSHAINHVSVETYLLDQPKFERVKAWIQICLDEVNNEVYNRDGIRITQSWANLSATGMWHHFHRHSNSVMSGILYLSTNNSRTWFSTDNIWHRRAYSPSNNAPPIYEFGSDNGQTARVIHKEESVAGKFLLFPSSLHHSVDENQDEHNRRSISFNTFMTGSIGSESELNALIL